MPENAPSYRQAAKRRHTPRSLLIRYGECEFSASRCRGQRRFATSQNGEQGRTIWLPWLCLEFRWGRL